VQVNGTLFTNRVSNPVGASQVAGDTTGFVNLMNAPGPLETRGGELYAAFNQEPIIATLYYATTHGSDLSMVTGRRRELPLTPRQTAGIDVALEDDESGAYGAIEIFYTGRQTLDDDPYLRVGKPYTIIGVLLSDRWKGMTVFINGENLTNVRLTQFEPLLRPRPGDGGRWTVDQWAPLEGRRVNVGVRWQW
jgi:iron complex outermembrane receptor protein